MKVKSWIKQIEVRQTAIAKERDKLDAMISEMAELKDCCDRAWDDLQSARDALSEMV
jgi:hypothetical protein